MKRALFSILAVLTLAVSVLAVTSDTLVHSGESVFSRTTDWLRVINLTDNTLSNIDTLLTGKSVYFGPYRVARSGSGRPAEAYARLRIWAADSAIVDDSLVAMVQFAPDTQFSVDSVTGWTGLDTIDPAGGYGSQTISCNNKAAQACWLGLRNISGDSIFIQGEIKAVFEY